jgi:hypothetical protein
MYTKNWLIVKDDSKRTFEVCGQDISENSFSNKVYGMQKMGMNVSCIIQPITNKTSSKGLIKITGYTSEGGLYERLLNEYRDITLRSAEEF